MERHDGGRLPGVRVRRSACHGLSRFCLRRSAPIRLPHQPEHVLSGLPSSASSAMSGVAQSTRTPYPSSRLALPRRSSIGGGFPELGVRRRDLIDVTRPSLDEDANPPIKWLQVHRDRCRVRGYDKARLRIRFFRQALQILDSTIRSISRVTATDTNLGGAGLAHSPKMHQRVSECLVENSGCLFVRHPGWRIKIPGEEPSEASSEASTVPLRLPRRAVE